VCWPTLHRLIRQGLQEGHRQPLQLRAVSPDVYQEVRDRLTSYFKSDHAHAGEEVAYLEHLSRGKLPKGIIHGESLPRQIMFRGEKVVASSISRPRRAGKDIFDPRTA